MALPRILGGPPLRLTGYPVELILAEKIVTAIQRGTANTRWRDFADIARLSGHDVNSVQLREAIARVAAHRNIKLRPLSDALDGFAPLAQSRWSGWRSKQQLTGSTPEQFADLLDQVVSFADRHL